MKKILEKLRQSEKLLVATVVLFMVMAGVALAISITSNESDADLDGIADSADLCVGTIVDKPLDDWGVNKYLWIGEGYFTVLTPSKGSKIKVFSELSMVQTKGCSCMDILKATDTRPNADNSGNYKFGCAKNVIEGWIKEVNQ